MSLYSLWVMEYAFIREFPLSGLVYGAHNKGTCKLPYGYVVIKGGGETILVDCGHDDTAYGKELGDRFGVENWRSPREVLAECGVAPEDVGHVIITHAHFDHMGGIDLFPNAKFYIQEKELSKWIWSLSLDRRFRWLMVATDPNDILKCVKLANEGRLVMLDGDVDNLFVGIDIRVAEDSHTPGSQYVVVRNDGNPQSQDAWVFTGDLVYRVENLTGGDDNDPFYLPVGLATGSQTNLLLAMDAMQKAAGGDIRRIVAAHEERLPQFFPSRLSGSGLQVIEIALADGATSAVDS